VKDSIATANQHCFGTVLLVVSAAFLLFLYLTGRLNL